MNNKLIKRRPNKLLTGRNNYYAFGDWLFNKNDEGKVTDRSLNNLSNTGQGVLSATGTAIGQLGGGLIGGGLSSGVGNAVSSLSGIASTIPGIGGFLSAGLGLAGGAINRLFGSKLNEENIAKVENNINQLNNFKSGASSFDTLSQTWASAPTGMTFDDSYIGEDGIFSNKAKNKASNLRTRVASGNAWVQNSLNNNAENLSNTQMQNLLSNYKSFGGHLMTNGADFTNGITVVGNGGTHEENPNEGVQMGVDPEGIPNLVEEGEVVYNDYVFSNRLTVPKEVRKKYKLGNKKDLTFADAAIKMSKESEERPNDNISQNGLDDSMMKLMIEQEKVRSSKDKNTYAKGGRLGNKYWGGSWLRDQVIVPLHNEDGNSYNSQGFNFSLPTRDSSTPVDSPLLTGSQESNTSKPKGAPTWMRYIPAAASGAMALTDLLGITNKPDYSEATTITEAAKSASNYIPVRFSPVGNYLTYRPFDRDFYTNKLNAQAGATRRGILNTSGSNRAQAMAGLLAADYNAQTQMGDLFRKAEEYNLAQRQKVADFNRATNMFNSEGAFKADQVNLTAQRQAMDTYLKGALTASELRQKERQASALARSTNLSNFINSLGDIGRENFSRNMIVSDPSKYYTINADGTITYKNGYEGLSQEEKDYVDWHIAKNSKKKSRGGYLTRK